MSISPNSVEEVSSSPFATVTRSVTKAISNNPAKSLFYVGLGILIICLPFGVVFPHTYYGVLSLLGFIHLCQFALEERDKRKSHANN